MTENGSFFKALRKRSHKFDRSTSILSDLSETSTTFDMETIDQASWAVGAAVGMSRGSLRASARSQKRMKQMISAQESLVENDDDEDLPKVDQIRILKTNSPEWVYLLVGGIASAIVGASMPVYAILFGEVSSGTKKSPQLLFRRSCGRISAGEYFTFLYS